MDRAVGGAAIGGAPGAGIVYMVSNAPQNQEVNSPQRQSALAA
jgi:hypothetical protein